MKKIVIFIGLGLLNSIYAEATEENFKMSVGGYFVASGETLSNISSLDIKGTEINFDRDLNMDSVANSFKLDAQ